MLAMDPAHVLAFHRPSTSGSHASPHPGPPPASAWRAIGLEPPPGLLPPGPPRPAPPPRPRPAPPPRPAEPARVARAVTAPGQGQGAGQGQAQGQARRLWGGSENRKVHLPLAYPLPVTLPGGVERSEELRAGLRAMLGEQAPEPRPD